MSEEQHQFFRTRSRTRRLAMQAVYQSRVTEQDDAELLASFAEEADYEKIDQEHFKALVGAALKKEFDERITACMQVGIDEIDPIEYALISNAAYEIVHCEDIDDAVAITEAIHLAKKFGNDNSYRFVNAVLDCLSKNIAAK